MGGGGDMQRRVPRVDVVTNRDKEVGAGILTGRSGLKRVGGQARCLIEHSHDPDVVSGGDRSEERTQRTVVELVGSPTCLHHEYRLPDLERGITDLDDCQPCWLAVSRAWSRGSANTAEEPH